MNERIGLIGLGRMGLPIAAQLAERWPVTVWDMSTAAVGRAVGCGATAASAFRELARASTMMLLCLPSPSEVDQVVTGQGGLLAHSPDGCVIVDMTTGDPLSAQRFGEIVAARRMHYVDAPVLGRPNRCGDWTLPVGGPQGAFERVKPVLAALARRVAHVGDTGSGMTIKLLNNLMFAAINAISAEVAALAEQLDVDLQTFFDLVSQSEAATVSPLFLSLLPKMIERDFEPVFTVDLLAKDLRLAISMCEAQGLPLVVPKALQSIVDAAQAQGLGSRDSASLIEAYEAFHRSHDAGSRSQSKLGFSDRL